MTQAEGFPSTNKLLGENPKYYYIENQERKERPLTGR